MAENFLYLTTTGRSSGEPREIEIWFVEHAGRHYLVAQNRERAQWLKNIQHNSAIAFCIGTRDDHEALVPRRQATGRVVDAVADAQLVATIAELMNKKYNWSDGLVVELAS